MAYYICQSIALESEGREFEPAGTKAFLFCMLTLKCIYNLHSCPNCDSKNKIKRSGLHEMYIQKGYRKKFTCKVNSARLSHRFVVVPSLNAVHYQTTNQLTFQITFLSDEGPSVFHVSAVHRLAIFRFDFHMLTQHTTFILLLCHL